MTTAPSVRRLVRADAEALVPLRREALERHPLAFGATADKDRGLVLEFLHTVLEDPEVAAIFGSFEDGALMGMVGLVREGNAKRCHKAVIWGMYVSERARRRGTGRALMEAAVAHARGWDGVLQIHLSVTAASPEARALYEKVGFRAWGREPKALQWEGRFVDEDHMVLDLRTP